MFLTLCGISSCTAFLFFARLPGGPGPRRVCGENNMKEKKMKGRTIALGTLLVLCALLLCSCGRGGVKSEKEIMADMQEKQILKVVYMEDCTRK